jgi:uridine kinase
MENMPRYYSPYLDKEQPNFNRPEALDFDTMVRSCRAIAGFDLVILEGHFALHHEKMRNLMDIRIFVTIDVNEMLERRTQRNLAANYGGDRDNILHYNQECVLPMYHEHVLPTQRHAHLLIPNGRTDAGRRDAIIEALCEQILLAER